MSRRVDLVSYLVDLDALDAQRATFRHAAPAGSLCGLWLDREQWEALGRPGSLIVEPTPDGAR